MINVLIVGYGFVGKATKLFLTANGVDPNVIQIYDPAIGHHQIVHPISHSFLCVPTPQGADGRFDLTSLEEAYRMVSLFSDNIIIRSTIGPDQVDLFPKADLLPEFLRERHWEKDAVSYDMPCVWGTNKPDADLQNIITGTKRLVITDRKSAMMFKLARNSMLAARVSLANELFLMCQQHNIDYETVKLLLATDRDIGGSHYNVPGHDGKFGFGGKCLPKDLSHLSSLLDVALNFKSIYINNINKR